MYNEIFDLTGKKAVVTGGAGDLGKSMVEALLESGAEVVIIGHSGRGKELAEEYCAQGYKAHAVQADLGSREELEQGWKDSLEILNDHVDILINSAGIQRRYPCEDFPMEEWDKVIEINLTATFRMCQLAAKNMLPRGYGKIINIASMTCFFGGFTIPAYAASKAGVGQLTRALANEWAGKGINVNAIAPGYMDTKMNTALVNDPKRNAEILGRIPQGRWGNGDDMKGVTVLLSSPASDYISGAIIPVDGGYLGK